MSNKYYHIFTCSPKSIESAMARFEQFCDISWIVQNQEPQTECST